MSRLQWNVYIARIGFIEGEGAKLRPVLSLNEPVGEHKIIIIAPIYTAKISHKMIGDIQIAGNESAAAGLIRPSTIRLHRMVALPANDLQEHLGQVSSQIQITLSNGIKELFKL